MIAEERKLAPWDAHPRRAAWSVFGAFVLAGMAPLLPFLLPGLSSRGSFQASCAATAATFLMVGYAKGRSVGGPAWRSGLLTLLMGGSAALLAFGIGYLLSRLGVG
jgi:VIT1/CCC1 family predicted Fe2+/Mn2+ transporter